eukprot:TRINITY_DN433_c0_g2_i5.p2 TRINITY_DN433_c0_g2~~TRINITY_DN433_c0_g2_i5.p2  ORF type:complete len:179 (+),score=40.41 TRINITY_DN433_c0_g2_i5:248-784(+)
MVFQQQDSGRDLITGNASPAGVSSEEDSDDEADNRKGKAPYKQPNSYEFFAQNTPQQVFGSHRQPEEEGADFFAPSFSDLAAVARQANGTNGLNNGKGGGEANYPNHPPAPSPMNVLSNCAPGQAQPKYIGKLTVEERRKRIQRYLDKKARRVWGRKVEYQCRKNLASKRARVHGRFA